MQLKKQVSKNELVDSEWKKTLRNMLIQHRQDTVSAEKKITDLHPLMCLLDPGDVLGSFVDAIWHGKFQSHVLGVNSTDGS